MRYARLSIECRDAYFREEGVDVARDEQPDAHLAPFSCDGFAQITFLLPSLPKRSVRPGVEAVVDDEARQSDAITAKAQEWKDGIPPPKEYDHDGIGAIEQILETLDLRAVEAWEIALDKSAEYQITLPRSPMPAPEQEPPAADVGAVTLQPV
jgi:hypothetical protein